MVMVNLPTAGVDFHVPFGGRKGSSSGPSEQGRYAAEFYTTVKTAYNYGVSRCHGVRRLSDRDIALSERLLISQLRACGMALKMARCRASGRELKLAQDSPARAAGSLRLMFHRALVAILQ